MPIVFPQQTLNSELLTRKLIINELQAFIRKLELSQFNKIIRFFILGKSRKYWTKVKNLIFKFLTLVENCYFHQYNLITLLKT